MCLFPASETPRILALPQTPRSPSPVPPLPPDSGRSIAPRLPHCRRHRRRALHQACPFLYHQRV